MNVEIVEEFVSKHGINAEIIRHAESGMTSQNASDVHGVGLENIIKTLLFIGKNENAIVICLGKDRVNTDKLKELGVKKPHLATKEELKNILDAEPGGVPPIILPENIRKFIDSNVVKKKFVIGSAGSEFAGLKISTKDILKYSKAEIVDIVQ